MVLSRALPQVRKAPDHHHTGTDQNACRTPAAWLLPRFIVANVEAGAGDIVSGNGKVVRAAPADAGFFFKRDKGSSPLRSTVVTLRVVFQAQLGCVFRKFKRVSSFLHRQTC